MLSCTYAVAVALALGSTSGSAPPRNSGKFPIRRHVLPRDVSSLEMGGGESSLPDGGKSTSLGSTTTATEDFLTFCVDFSALPQQLAGSRDYKVVAVTGCQCSGKSTLLNALFGTGFPVLENADDGLPRRTTVGAWVDLQLCSPPRHKEKTVSRTPSNGSDSSDSAFAGNEEPVERAKGEDLFSSSTGVDGSAEADSRGGRGMISSTAKTATTSIAAKPFVLVDVEGTQSRDRGSADGAEFDTRTMLFAVMASDVIMLNLWAHDVGRADGQAYTVLRSVFEEAVRLYDDGDGEGLSATAGGGGGRARASPAAAADALDEDRPSEKGATRFPKVLMVVLRDVEEDGHLEALQRAARANMEALWRDVDKPSSLRDADLSEVFELRTCGLPHFNYQRRDFALKAAALGRSFLDPSDHGYVFPGDRQEEGERSGKGSPKKGNPGEPGGRAMVPLSMLPQRLEGMWASASTNVRLSEAPLRSKQEGVVATATLAESCLSDVRPACGRLLRDVEEAADGPMPLLQFGSDAKGIVDGALRSFQTRASRSQSMIAAPPAMLREKREWLVEAVARELEPAFRLHARQLRRHFHDQFEEAFSCVLGGAPDFDESSRKMAKSARKKFVDATKLAIPDIPGVADVWRLHWEAELLRLNGEMENRVQDRLSEGTWMLPPDPTEQAAAAAGKKKMPWWKGLALRAAAMYFNYLQATQHLRRAKKASERRERDVPRLPLF